MRKDGSRSEGWELVRMSDDKVRVVAEVGEMRWPDNTPICKVDIAFECTGIASCVQASIYVSANLDSPTHP